MQTQTSSSKALSASKKSFKAKMLEAREDAIIQSVNRLLSEKGFDAMTVDEVANEVGIAKASLYKHFASKEDLACAAMVKVMQKAQLFVRECQSQTGSPLTKIKQVARWTMALQLQGNMPSLPSQNSTLRSTLMASKDYMDGLMEITDVLGAWIEEAQKDGFINPELPSLAVLYTLFARACDPVLEFLKMSDLYTDEQILDMVMSSCFNGLASNSTV